MTTQTGLSLSRIIFPLIAATLIFTLGLMALLLEILSPPITAMRVVGFIFSFILYVLMVISFYNAVTVSPGFTPSHYLPEAPDIQLEYAKERYRISVMRGERLIDMLYPVQFCGECQSFRPPRSYHCRRCGKCVLKRDHHCPWIGQCVGWGNYKYFIQFLWVAPVNLLVGVLWHCIGLWRSYTATGSFEYIGTGKDAIRLFCAIVDISLAVAISSLGIIHTYHLIIGTTGQEETELYYLRRNKVTNLVCHNFRFSYYSNSLEAFHVLKGSA